MASLSRQHFIALGDALHWSTLDVDRSTREEIVRAVSDALATFNGRFDRETFSDRVKTGPYRFSVVENVPGYMPDTLPERFETRRDAEEYAQGLAEELREQGYRVTGNRRDGYTAHHPTKTHDLGRVIDVVDLVEVS